MDKERDIIHKILDNEAGEEEKQAIERRRKVDPAVRDEFEGLSRAVRMLKESERREPPAFFTSGVMKKLPVRKTSVAGRIREFFLGSRMLRWNMATALAMAAVLIVALVTVTRMPQKVVTNVAMQSEPVVTVRLTFRAPEAHSVAVAGDFNKWRTSADAMKKTDGEWSIDLKLKPGEYSYSFIVDGKSWVPDPGAEMYRDDGFGSRNAVLRVNI
jgi:anti-sigma factor RsiW